MPAPVSSTFPLNSLNGEAPTGKRVPALNASQTGKSSLAYVLGSAVDGGLADAAEPFDLGPETFSKVIQVVCGSSTAILEALGAYIVNLRRSSGTAGEMGTEGLASATDLCAKEMRSSMGRAVDELLVESRAIPGRSDGVRALKAQLASLVQLFEDQRAAYPRVVAAFKEELANRVGAAGAPVAALEHRLRDALVKERLLEAATRELAAAKAESHEKAKAHKALQSKLAGMEIDYRRAEQEREKRAVAAAAAGDEAIAWHHRALELEGDAATARRAHKVADDAAGRLLRENEDLAAEVSRLRAAAEDLTAERRALQQQVARVGADREGAMALLAGQLERAQRMLAGQTAELAKARDAARDAARLDRLLGGWEDEQRALLAQIERLQSRLMQEEHTRHVREEELGELRARARSVAAVELAARTMVTKVHRAQAVAATKDDLLEEVRSALVAALAERDAIAAEAGAEIRRLRQSGGGPMSAGGITAEGSALTLPPPSREASGLLPTKPWDGSTAIGGAPPSLGGGSPGGSGSPSLDAAAKRALTKAAEREAAAEAQRRDAAKAAAQMARPPPGTVFRLAGLGPLPPA